MILATALLTATLAQTAPAAAVDGELRLGLREAMGRAAASYPELLIADAEQQGAEALVDLARWTRLSPTFTNTTLFGVVPGARGDIFESPDSNRSLDNLGPFVRLRLEAKLPISTFGRIKTAEAAARLLVISKDAKRAAKEAVAMELVTRAYFGWLLAADSLELVDVVRTRIDELLDQLAERDDDDADPFDVMRARSYGFELDATRALLVEEMTVAASGLRALAGLDAGFRVRPAADGLAALAGELPDLTLGLDRALEERPDLKEIALSAEAQGLWARVAHKERLPILQIEGRFDWGKAPGRDEQDNPFVYEPFNVTSIAAFLAFKWDLNLKTTGAKARKRDADADALRAQHTALVTRASHDIVEAHARLTRTHDVHRTTRRSISTAASWYRMAEEGYELQTTSIKDLIEAYTNYIKARGAYFEAVHDRNVATIGWRLAVGAAPLVSGENP